MHITWHGMNCIRIQGKDVTIVLDPYAEGDGPKLPRWQADIVTVSSPESDDTKGGAGAFIINTPGEFEVKGAFVYGVEWKREKKEDKSVLYRINLEDISIAHVGGLDQVLSNQTLELLEGADILCLPVGDKDLLSVKDAVEVVARIEPRIVIPMSYAAKGFRQLAPVQDFFKELGVTPQIQDKLKITRKDLPEEDRHVYQLELA